MKRRGVILLLIMVCFALAAILFVILARLTASELATGARRRNMAEARWLVEAGIERGAARWAEDAKYTGETWTIPARRLDGRNGAVVRIRVEKSADRYRIQAEADYPDDPVYRCRWKKEVAAQPPTQQEKKSSP